MKKLFVLILGVLFFMPAFAQEKDEPANGPQITFEEAKYDFGEIHQGDVVTHTFTFENTGTEPLILSNVLTSCGCTATNWPKEPIAPGKGAEITVKFNSAGKLGHQNKIVTVVSNAVNAQERVRIVTNVLPKKKD